jgi:broad specificity phosphatase PhoE
MPKVCLFVSHNSRIQCLLDNIQPSVEKLRFQNCAIMELYLSRNYIHLDLVYSGEITEDEKQDLSRKYYSTEADPEDPTYEASKYRRYPRIEFRGNVCIPIIRKLKLVPEDLTEDYVFYGVRHGQSEHNVSTNVASIFHMTLDTSIVQSGITAAEKAGKFIQDLGISDKLHRIYVSDLKRTAQTVRTIMKIIERSGITPIVLPCASEVVESGQHGNCDRASADLYTVQKLGRENYPSCTIDDIVRNRYPCDLNWELYLSFYGGKMRGETDTVWGRTFSRKVIKQHCENTTVIAMAIYEINHKTYESLDRFIRDRALGGGRKTSSRIFPVFHKRVQYKKRKYSQKYIKN